MTNEPVDPNDLSAAIQKGLEAARNYENQRSTVFGRGFEQVLGPASKLVTSNVPPAWFQSALEVALSAANLSIVKSELGHDLDDLEACENAALKVQGWATTMNASSGGVASFFGGAGAVVDIPATITFAARNVLSTGLAYGFDGQSDDERLFQIMILDLATKQAGEARQETIDQIVQLSNYLSKPPLRSVVDRGGEWLAEKVVDRIARQLGISLGSRKVGQMVPIVGSAVAVAVNWSFQTDVSRAARYAYRMRWLMNRQLLPKPT